MTGVVAAACGTDTRVVRTCALLNNVRPWKHDIAAWMGPSEKTRIPLRKEFRATYLNNRNGNQPLFNAAEWNSVVMKFRVRGVLLYRGVMQLSQLCTRGFCLYVCARGMPARARVCECECVNVIGACVGCISPYTLLILCRPT